MLIDKLFIFFGLLITALMSSVLFSFVVVFKLFQTLTLAAWNWAVTVTPASNHGLIERS
ncbi:MAG: hypothetical protein RIC80_16630 [Cyclobacteriaceae bacterium]